MGKVLSMEIRQEIIRGRNTGEGVKSLAGRLGISERVVYQIEARFKEAGEAGLKPSYGNCGPKRPTRGDFMFRAVCYLRHLHKDWGCSIIHSCLLWKYPGRAVPCERTVGYWLNWNGAARKKKLAAQP